LQKQKEETAFQKKKVEQVKRIIEPFVMRRVKEDVSSNSFNSLTDTSCSSKDWIGIDVLQG
jgi:SNF2 family DNA or RNA helicase